jgi:hypothetical protein
MVMVSSPGGPSGGLVGSRVEVAASVGVGCGFSVAVVVAVGAEVGVRVEGAVDVGWTAATVEAGGVEDGGGSGELARAASVVRAPPQADASRTMSSRISARLFKFLLLEEGGQVWSADCGVVFAAGRSGLCVVERGRWWDVQ